MFETKISTSRRVIVGLPLLVVGFGAPGVDKEPLVADVQVGAVVTIGWLHLAYTHVYRTQEFEEQDRGDRFGAISLSAMF